MKARALAVVGRRIRLVLGVALLIAGFGLAVGPLPQPFYATVAQVLPIFLLVAIVEGRYFTRLEARAAFDRFFLRGMLALVVGGELAALAAIALEEDLVVLRGLVFCALGCATLLLWLYASIGPARIGPIGACQAG